VCTIRRLPPAASATAIVGIAAAVNRARRRLARFDRETANQRTAPRE